MTEAEHIQMHYGVCRTMRAKPRSCRCMQLKREPYQQVCCENWVSVPDRSYDEIFTRLKALGKATEQTPA